MVNPNRWSWSGAPRKAHAHEDAVVSNQSLIPASTTKPDTPETNISAETRPHSGAAAGVSSRKNRWSWRPDAAISVTLEHQQENDQDVQGQADRPTLASPNGPRRLSKRIKKVDAPATSRRPRPLSMIAHSSSTFGASPSLAHPEPQQHDATDQSPAQATHLPSTGVKHVFNRFLTRQFSKRQLKTSRQEGEGEPTPPPSRHQEHQISKPSMRRGPHLHNPQNTLREGLSPVDPANPGTRAPVQSQLQGHIDNGRIAEPLPEVDEQSEFQLDNHPDSATSLGPNTTSSPAAAPSAEETGLLGRLMPRRLAPRDKDDMKRWISLGDNTSLPAGADIQHSSSPGPVANVKEAIDSHTTHKKVNDKNKTKTQDPSSSSFVPRLLRQAAKPQQTPAGSDQNAGGTTPHKTELQQQMPTAGSAETAQPKLRSKPSFGKRFWSRSSSNHFGDDTPVITSKNETPAPAPVLRPVYVPRHAASDFSRTTNGQRYQGHSYSLTSDGDNGVRPLATIAAESGEDEPPAQQLRPQPTRYRSISADKRRSRELSSSKYEAPSPQELHRRLEIVKSSEIEVVTTREPVQTELWAQQHALLHSNSNASSSNAKAPARSQSRPRSSQRHSFNLVSDPFARDLTPPKSPSPVEMEAPFDAPCQQKSQAQCEAPKTTSHQKTQQRPQQSLQPTKSSNTRSNTRLQSRAQERSEKEMSDYERFIADAEVAEREYHAQMWKNLARRSGHYGYSENVYTSFRPDPPTINVGAVNATTQRTGRRDSAYYSKRASMMSTGPEEERNMFYGQSVGGDNGRELKHQPSISRRIAGYIKPKSGQRTEDWMAPTGRTNRRSIITGVVAE